MINYLVDLGADDFVGALAEVIGYEAEYLLKIFAEERANHNPTQSPQQH